MTVRVELVGHEFDLMRVQECFPTGDPRVTADDGGRYMESERLDLVYTEGGKLLREAERLLARMNAAAMIADPSFKRIGMVNRFERGPNHSHVVGTDSATVREHVTVIAGTAEARLGALTATAGGRGARTSLDHVDRLKLADSDADVADLLDLVGRADALDWVVLWKAIEVVRYRVGSRKAFIATGWVTEDEYLEFEYAANNPQASGLDARHSRRPAGGRIPGRIISIEEGRALFCRVAAAWLRSLT